MKESLRAGTKRRAGVGGNSRVGGAGALRRDATVDTQQVPNPRVELRSRSTQLNSALTGYPRELSGGLIPLTSVWIPRLNA